MNEKKIDEMAEIMKKIDETDKLTIKKEKEIQKKEQQLIKEAKPVMVEERKKEIEELKTNKEEFDQMTINALVNMKRDILMQRREMQSEYQKTLLDAQIKKNEVQAKLSKMKQRNMDDETKLEEIENSANKALEKINDELKNASEKYKEMNTKLDNWENKITEFAIRLNAIEALDGVSEHDQKEPEHESTSEPKVPTKGDETPEPPVEHTEPEAGDEPPEPSSHSTIKEAKGIKITIGSTGTITYDGKEYPIDTKTIKEGLNLNRDNLKDYPEGVQDIIKGLGIEKDTPLDMTVLHLINSVDIVKEQKDKLMIRYLTNVVKSQYEKKTQLHLETTDAEKMVNEHDYQPVEVIYDMNDISKPMPFWKVLFSRRPDKKFLTGEEKEFIAEIGNRANRYGIGKTIGQYQEPKGIGAKILGLFKKNRELLPEAKDMRTIDMSSKESIKETTQVEAKAAENYNKAIDNTFEYNKETHKVNVTEDKKDKFHENLQVEIKDEKDDAVQTETRDLERTSKDITR